MTITIEDLLLSLPLVSSEEMLAGMSFIKRVIVILDSNILSLLVTPLGEDWPEDQKLFTEVYQCTEWVLSSAGKRSLSDFI
ncbi:hypothetical protein [Microcystis wesenbergii]|jgi:hypothetical protein|uniref:Uncharacterized protein n=1 Tax=Microcystis wesenbergii NRERC-220 TaxID=3068991 RepID=A0ABU3HPV3_9CHRO|nr:hypothetical protein [Microcystis wesenbergii]MDT3676582.1 hypothetical protein [Microcystis wesenbergii NRERC-220]